MKTTTLIDHEIRKAMTLSCNEYCICDYIETETNFDRRVMAAYLGITKTAMIGLIKRLITDGYVEKTEIRGSLRCTEKWKKNINFKTSQETISEKPTFISWLPRQPLRKISNVKNVTNMT